MLVLSDMLITVHCTCLYISVTNEWKEYHDSNDPDSYSSAIVFKSNPIPIVQVILLPSSNPYIHQQKKRKEKKKRKEEKTNTTSSCLLWKIAFWTFLTPPHAMPGDIVQNKQENEKKIDMQK